MTKPQTTADTSTCRDTRTTMEMDVEEESEDDLAWVADDLRLARHIYRTMDDPRLWRYLAPHAADVDDKIGRLLYDAHCLIMIHRDPADLVHYAPYSDAGMEPREVALVAGLMKVSRTPDERLQTLATIAHHATCVAYLKLCGALDRAVAPAGHEERRVGGVAMRDGQPTAPPQAAAHA